MTIKDSSLSRTEQSILRVIKGNNEIVSYNIEDKTIFLQFYNGNEAMSLELYIDNNNNIQARLVAKVD